MATNYELLVAQSANKLHRGLYEEALDPKSWPLQAGTCYIHDDVEILSPDLRQQIETAQFTAYYATGAEPYDQDATYTSYLIEKVQENPDAKGLFVTMYGPTTSDTKVPSRHLKKQSFKHGMWLPTFMAPAKKRLHTAQGPGSIGDPWPGSGANIYFAGNNLTMDSVEGALISAMAVANYAFDTPYPLPLSKLTSVAFGLFAYLYLDYMFPVKDDAHRAAALTSLGARSELHL